MSEATDEAAHATVQAPVVGCFSRSVVAKPRMWMAITFVVILLLSGASMAKPFTEPVNTGWTNQADAVTQDLDAWTALQCSRDCPSGDCCRFQDDDDDRRRRLQSEKSKKVRAQLAEHGEGRSLSQQGDMARMWARDVITFVYQAADGASMFSDAQFAKMVQMETDFMGIPTWDQDCVIAMANRQDCGNGPPMGYMPARCATPTSIMAMLHVAPTVHQRDCLNGFCMMPYCQIEYVCGVSVAWGTIPCFSTAYDWREGVLAPRSQWATILSTQQLAIEMILGESALSDPRNFKMLLSELKNISATDITLSSQYVRSRYAVGTFEMDITNEGSIKTFVDEVNSVADSVSATKADARKITEPSGESINVFWISFSPVGLLAKVYFDYYFALISFIFIFLYMCFNISSFTLALAGIFEIIMSIPLALTLWKIIARQDNIDFLQLVMVFLILCIGADDVFVFMDTWKASAAMPLAVSGTLETRFAYTWRKAAGTMLATTLTTCICLVLTALSTIPTVKAFGMFGSFLVLADYLQVITWFPAVVVWHEKHVCLKGQPLLFCCFKATPVAPGEQAKEAPVAAFMRDKVAPLLKSLRFLLVLLAIGFAAGGLVTRMKFFEPAVAIPMFRLSHPYEYSNGINSQEFFQASQGGDDHVYVGLMYGLKERPVTYPTPDQILPSRDDLYAQLGDIKPAYDTSFDLTPAVQTAIVDNCVAARVSGLVEGGSAFCLLEDVKANVERGGGVFPLPNEAALSMAINNFYATADPFFAPHCYPNATQSYDDWIRPLGCYKSWLDDVMRDYNELTGVVKDYDQGGKIVAMYNSFRSRLSRRSVETGIFGGDPRAVAPTFQDWTKFTEDNCVDVPCVQSIYTVIGAVKFMSLLKALSTFANSTILICVLACFLVLVVVTMNVIVALYATITVGFVILSVLGCIIWVGLEDGMYENVFTILVVGMSIDYAVHLAHFYNHAPGSRYAKAREALYGVGVSVLGGAITTVGAGVPLLFCVVMFFYVQGIFILFTALCALFHSMFFLIPILMIAGPERRQGDLTYFVDLFCGGAKGKGAPAKQVQNV